MRISLINFYKILAISRENKIGSNDSNIVYI